MNTGSFFRWRPHPWHGLEVGPEPPGLVNAYIEITPYDRMKYEVDKVTGYTRIDRPQLTSSQPPALYGFVPRTYCADRVGTLLPEAGEGDMDPLDICVLSERPITRAEVVVPARVIGGLPMVDGGQADDKIIGVLDRDPVYGNVRDIVEIHEALVDRLTHYFSTYKTLSGQPADVSIGRHYGRAHAEAVVRAAMDDYREAFFEAPSQP
jgi:inorganic pyrophosphatase